jgi:hypothetical protein
MLFESDTLMLQFGNDLGLPAPFLIISQSKK